MNKINRIMLVIGLLLALAQTETQAQQSGSAAASAPIPSGYGRLIGEIKWKKTLGPPV